MENIETPRSHIENGGFSKSIKINQRHLRSLLSAFKNRVNTALVLYQKLIRYSVQRAASTYHSKNIWHATYLALLELQFVLISSCLLINY